MLCCICLLQAVLLYMLLTTRYTCVFAGKAACNKAGTQVNICSLPQNMAALVCCEEALCSCDIITTYLQLQDCKYCVGGCRVSRALAGKCLRSRAQRVARAASTDVEAEPVETAEFSAEELKAEEAHPVAPGEEQAAPEADARRRSAPAGGGARGRRPPREVKYRFEDLSIGQEVEGVVVRPWLYFLKLCGFFSSVLRRICTYAY